MIDQLVALIGQVLLDPSGKLAGAGQLSPLRLDGVAVSGGQELGGDQNVVVTVAVVAPQGGVGSSGNHAGDGVVTALGGGGQHDGGVQQLGLGNGLESVALGDIAGGKSLLVVLVVLAQDAVIHGGRVIVVVGGVILPSFGSQTGVGLLGSRLLRCGLFRRGLGFGRGLFRRGLVLGSGGGSSLAAGSQSKDHAQSQKQCENLFHGFSS